MSVVTLRAFMLSVIVLSAITLGVIMLSVVLLSVVDNVLNNSGKRQIFGKIFTKTFSASSTSSQQNATKTLGRKLQPP